MTNYTTIRVKRETRDRIMKVKGEKENLGDALDRIIDDGGIKDV